MEFENQYLDFDEYKELGGTISKDMPFNLLEFKARKYVDKYTFGRLIDLDEQCEEVKGCIYELIETLLEYQNTNTNIEKTTNGIASESTDGYSVTYINNTADAQNITKGKEAKVVDIIYTYLANCKLDDGTPYLYRG